ncbi:MAG: hydrogenase maturation protease [Rhodomicrobium sp.]
MTLNILTLGLGNSLLTDDGAGVHVIDALRRHPRAEVLHLVDGGTLGFRLAGIVADHTDCIIIDAADLGDTPGTLKVLGIGDIHDWLRSSQRRSVHEAGLIDLLSLLHLEERLPARLAIIAIQPSCADWGGELTEAVAAVIPKACATAIEIARQWKDLPQEESFDDDFPSPRNGREHGYRWRA